MAYRGQSLLPLRRSGPVVRLGNGELGGKARVLPFLQRIVRQGGLEEEFRPHRISVPETWVITTSVFTEFIVKNGLEHLSDVVSDGEIRRRFLAGRLPDAARASLQMYLDARTHPQAVRSSASSEDMQHHTTAGLYSTHFITNQGRGRLRQLTDAVKLVWSSAYFADAGRYIREHSIIRENERMAVALQGVVGSRRGDVHYPLLSGVAQSINYFPVGPMKPEHGVVTVAMGLGRRVVQGLDGLRFCPAHPMVRPDLQADADPRRTTQRVFDAVTVEAGPDRLSGAETDTLVTLPIEDAEPHGTLRRLASVWDPETGIYYDSLMRKGTRILTFNRLLRGTTMPLPAMLRRVLEVVRDGFGQHVEVEFAVELEGRGANERAHLVLLQARPLPAVQESERVVIPDVAPDRVLLSTDQTLGHGAAEGVRDIVFVDPALFSLKTSPLIAQEVAALNDRLRDEKRRYLLLGPGRWGSSNVAVGIPVRFRHIDGARLIAEVLTEQVALEPSQGTHFFHNVVSRSLFYLTVDTRVGHALDLQWLRAQPNAADTRYAKLIAADVNLSVRVDAGKRRGLVYRT